MGRTVALVVLLLFPSIVPGQENSKAAKPASASPARSLPVCEEIPALAVGLVAETAFGPIVVSESIGDTGHHKWFFSLGRVF
jgi:hypothetical protein